MKGKRIITSLLSLSLLVCLLSGCKTSDLESDEFNLPVITLGSDNYPPYNYLNDDGNPTGIDVDLASEAFKRLGYRVEVVYIDWEKNKELLESGKIDCIMACFSMEGRLNDYKWAGPYISSRQVIAVNKDSDIYTLDDLKGTGRTFVAGLISTKRKELEEHDAIKARYEQAKAVVGDNIALSPQCGFASVEEGNCIDEETQWKKIDLLVSCQDFI